MLEPMTPEKPIAVRAATIAERSAALELALSCIPAAQRAPAIATARLALHERAENLLVAPGGNQIVGAVWGAPQPGGFAEIWPARLVEHRPRATPDPPHRTPL